MYNSNHKNSFHNHLIGIGDIGNYGSATAILKEIIDRDVNLDLIYFDNTSVVGLVGEKHLQHSSTSIITDILERKNSVNTEIKSLQKRSVFKLNNAWDKNIINEFSEEISNFKQSSDNDINLLYKLAEDLEPHQINLVVTVAIIEVNGEKIFEYSIHFIEIKTPKHCTHHSNYYKFVTLRAEILNLPPPFHIQLLLNQNFNSFEFTGKRYETYINPSYS